MVTDENTVGDVTEGGVGVAAAAPDNCACQDVPSERAALVKQWLERIKASKKHHEPAFKRIDKSMLIASYGVDTKAEIELDKYVVPIINRHINQAVASLYARHPTAVAKRKQKLMYTLWDGDPQSIQAAMQRVQAAVMPVQDPVTGMTFSGEPDPNDMMLLQEIEAVKQELLQLERMSKTLKLLFAYYFAEQSANYKKQLKSAVRRAKVCGVAWVKLGFQRALKKNPDVEAQIADVTSKIAALEVAMQKMAAGELEEGTAAVEELRLNLQDLQSRPEIVVREGPVLSFPKAKSIIVDKDCWDLNTFAGARWIAHEFPKKTCDDILEEYNVDVKGKHTEYRVDSGSASDKTQEPTYCCVYEVYDKKLNQAFTVCDGYSDFLKEPAEPDVRIERFWPLFPIIFNEIESEDEIYPPSDAWNARYMQREYNSTRQGRREHRIAARPRFAAAKGQLEKEDKDKLSGAEPFSIVELAAMTPDMDIKKLLQRIDVPGIDPNLYETETVFHDIQRVVGSQEANLGGTSNSTATESSIAENSRMTASSADVDALDDLLTDLSRAMGQLMLLELSRDTVIEIAGPGAVWPEAAPSREQVVKDLLLEVEAGSSGRPNKAAELANFERAMPYLSMLPGINPIPLAKKGLDLLELDLEEAIVEGLPSIVAMNQMAGRNQQAGGDPGADPNQQGDKGSQNAPDTQRNEPGSQPAYPEPAMQ